MSNKITSNEIKKLIDLYFLDKFAMYKLQYDSYSQFINEVIYKTLIENQNIIHVEEDKEKNIIYEHYLKFENIELRYPENDQGQVIYPEDARKNHLSYSSKLIADVKQILKIKDINKQSEEERIIGEENKILITKIPIMVRSKFCSTNIKSEYKNTECDYDPGCHFIIKGSEKVVLSLERMCENKMLIFEGKKDDILYKMTVNSKQHDINANIQKIELEIKQDGSINLITKQFGSVPVCIIFKALGLETDEKIVDHIIYNKDDLEMLNTFRKSILLTSNETYSIEEEEKDKEVELKKVIKTEDALIYLGLKIRDNHRYNQTNIQMKMYQKKQSVLYILANDFLPHMGVNQKDYNQVFQNKIYYLGLMINKLLQCYLERIKPDDRDDYVNKRIDLPGMLMAKLFRDYYKKMILDVSKIFKKRYNGDNINPINIINNIKSSVIEQGLNLALSQGIWGSPKKKGVAQVLQRLTYLFTLSYLRRISLAPFVNESNNKVDKMRHVNNIQLGYICVTQDTEILLSNNQTKLIKDLTLDDEIITVNPKTLKEENSKLKRIIKINKNDIEKICKSNYLYEFETITGRKIKTTSEHPLLIYNENNKYEWIQAKNIKKDDFLIIRNSQKNIIIDKENNVIFNDNNNNKYVKNLINMKLLNVYIDQDKSEILARLLGSNITDGSLLINKNNIYLCSRFNLGEKIDAENVINDIKKLGFDNIYIKNQKNIFNENVTYNTWRVQKSGTFAYLMKIIGCTIGKKTENIKILPDWIINGNNKIKIEFLNAYIGGDGCRISILKNNTSSKINVREICQSCNKETLDHTIIFQNNIIKLFSEFEIQAKLKIKKNDKFYDRYNVFIVINNSIDNILNYLKIINYTYCNEKKIKSSICIEFILYKKKLIDDHINRNNNIIKIFNEGVKIKEIMKKYNLSKSGIKKIINNNNKTKRHNINITYNDFIEFCNNIIIDDKIKCQIKTIKHIELEDVYDITTISENHSFIGNSIINSNCSEETPDG